MQSRLRLFCSWLVARGDLKRNPLDGVKLPRVRGGRGPGARAFDEGEVAALIAAAVASESRHWQARQFGPVRSSLYIVLAHTGLRYSEAMRMRWDWIDWRHATLRVRADKAGRGDSIPLHPEAVEALRRLRDDPATRSRITRREFVFLRVSHHSLVRDMRRAKVERRVDGRGGQWHCFRKGLVTALLARGATSAEVQKISRHADVNVMHRYYMDLRPGDAARVVAKMPRFAKSGACSRGDPTIDSLRGRVVSPAARDRGTERSATTGMEPGGIEPRAPSSELMDAIREQFEANHRLMTALCLRLGGSHESTDRARGGRRPTR